MVEKKNQHYVPQFYFRFFSSNGKDICIFNIDNKNHFVGPFKNQSSKDYFYMKGKELEDAFEKIEQPQRESINKLIKSKSLKAINKEEYIEILKFITFQDTRTNYSKRDANETTQHLVREYVKPKMLQDKELSKKFTKEEIDKLELTFPADHLMSIGIGLQAPILISDLIPVLLVNKTELEFLFSDHPIILYNLFFHRDTFESHIGFQSPGLLIFCPLSKNLCLLLFDSKTYKIGGSKENLLEIDNPPEIEKINKLQLYRCDRNIYYSNSHQKEKLNKLFEEFSKDNVKSKEITKFEKLKILNKPNSEVLMIGERNINEDIKLSFLTVNEVTEELGRVRNQELVNAFKNFLKKNHQ
ncbi:MAG: DUF4238 domain-containing protein [Nanoarchaeota archaeon]